jgi:hypothetical protein
VNVLSDVAFAVAETEKAVVAVIAVVTLDVKADATVVAVDNLVSHTDVIVAVAEAREAVVAITAGVTQKSRCEFSVKFSCCNC